MKRVFTFIELKPFARVREQLLDDDEFARLQLHLIAQPEAGDVIPGSDGCRIHEKNRNGA
ncbi:MAG: hypothetical protein HY525_10960 [Betaproteobacteria bacterium]|nr:hypothetical protein [Betaproteobacteria bacterium]